MSKGKELYVRKSRSSDQTMMSDTEEQVWDDSSMTAAYDKAVNKANAEIAKQIAMETNSKFKGDAKTNQKKGKGPANSTKTQSPQGLKAERPKPKVWTVGMPCRAVFFEDGEEYEAEVYAVLDNMECVVRFLGYDNSEVVKINTLKESSGDEPRMRQIEQATGNKFDDGFESLSNEDTSGVSAAAAPAYNQQKAKKVPKKKSQSKPRDFPAMPNLPFLPNLPDLFYAGMGGSSREPHAHSMPLPPPPGALPDAQEHAFSSMLISWYMSGYQTGLYQGMLKCKDNRRR